MLPVCLLPMFPAHTMGGAARSLPASRPSHAVVISSLRASLLEARLTLPHHSGAKLDQRRVNVTVIIDRGLA